MDGIFTHIDHEFMINVGKYSSPMEHMGKASKGQWRAFHSESFRPQPIMNPSKKSG